MCAAFISLVCTVLCTIAVTTEAEAGMTVCGQCWGQVKLAHCTSPLNVRKVCVCMGDVLQCVSLLGEPWAVFLQYTAWWSVSSSAGLYALCGAWQHRAARSLPSFPARSAKVMVLQWPARCMWPNTIWPPVLVRVSGALIPEHNCLSQFNEDTGNPLCLSENLISCSLV